MQQGLIAGFAVDEERDRVVQAKFGTTVVFIWLQGLVLVLLGSNVYHARDGEGEGPDFEPDFWVGVSFVG